MRSPVAILSQELVIPSETTPTCTLSLSWLDRYPTQSALISSLHVYKHGRNPAQVIKAALSKALVPYFPFAGRLTKSDGGELCIACTGEGAWFVVASADCYLSDINYLEHPFMIPEADLLPNPVVDPHDEGKQVLLMQVTEFKCGGFVVGLRSNHTLADGPGAGQFVTAIAQIARGSKMPTVLPIWCRDRFPKPSIIAQKSSLKIPITGKLQYQMINFSSGQVNNLKNQYVTQSGLRCSMFEVLIAKAWQCRTQVINFDPKQEVELCFAMNARALLRQLNLLPSEEGYYGNCYYLMKVTATSGNIVRASTDEIVNLIREAKSNLPTEFARWVAGEMNEDPYKITTAYESMLVSDWSWLGFSEVDYGWGRPEHVMPLTNSDYVPTCILLRSPAHKSDICLVTQCVRKEHMKDFNHRMIDF